MRRGRIPTRTALDYAASIAAALSAAHAAGIVHRDIKPENVMVLRSGGVKVLDYGLAKLVESPVGDSDSATLPQQRVTGSGQIVGTVSYMSPEQKADILVMPLSGGASRIAVQTAGDEGHPFFDSSGQWLYFSKSHKNLYRVPGPGAGMASCRTAEGDRFRGGESVC